MLKKDVPMTVTWVAAIRLSPQYLRMTRWKVAPYSAYSRRPSALSVLS